MPNPMRNGCRSTCSTCDQYTFASMIVTRPRKSDKKAMHPFDTTVSWSRLSCLAFMFVSFAPREEDCDGMMCAL